MKLDDLASLLRTGESYILTSHESPDGDGLGAMYALCRALEKLGKKAAALLSEPLPPKYRFLDERGVFRVAETPPAADLDPASSLLLILDTNDAHYAGRIADTARAAGLSPRQLHKLMRRHGLHKEDFRPRRGE